MQCEAFNPEDIAIIKRLFTETFTHSEGEPEGILIGNLVDDLITHTAAQDLYGFVAIEHKQIVGCIFFSRLSFAHPLNAFILAPVAVHTSYQGKGIGQGLINFGMSHLKAQHVELIMTYGDSRFYSKVGFKPVSENLVKAPLALSYPEGWLGQSLTGNAVTAVEGQSTCVKAFNKPDYW